MSSTGIPLQAFSSTSAPCPNADSAAATWRMRPASTRPQRLPGETAEHDDRRSICPGPDAGKLQRARTGQRREQVAAAVAGVSAPSCAPWAAGMIDDEDRRRRVSSRAIGRPQYRSAAKGLAHRRDLFPPRDETRARPAHRLPRGQLRQRRRAGRQLAHLLRAVHDGVAAVAEVTRPARPALGPATMRSPSNVVLACWTSTKPDLIADRSSTRAPAPITSTSPGA